MTGVRRFILILLPMLFGILGSMGMVSVCPCHDEIFQDTCACSSSNATCDSPSVAIDGQPAHRSLMEHHCSHQHLTSGDWNAPVASPEISVPRQLWYIPPAFAEPYLHLCALPQEADSEVSLPAPPLRVVSQPYTGYLTPLLI